MSPGPRFNLSQQAVQPLFQIASRVEVSIGVAPAVGASIKLSHVEASVSTDLAYQGLSCLQIEGELSASLHCVAGCHAHFTHRTEKAVFTQASRNSLK